MSFLEHMEHMDTLRQIERLLVAQTAEPDIDVTIAISNIQPYKIEYAGRKHLYLLSNASVTVTVEDIATINVPSNTWTDISFQEGQRIFYPAGGTTTSAFLVRATDHILPTYPTSGPRVGIAVTPYASNPTQTASAGADTVFKWGTNGTTQVQHASIQNNTGSNIFYAFDQSTTVSTDAVYVLVNGAVVFWDRAVSVLHFSSAAQQSFGGTTGITVEGFL